MVDGLTQKKSNIAVLDQKELAEEDIFKTVADHAPIMLWMTNRKGVPVFFNQRWLHFTGLQPDEALGDAWLDTLHPDDRAACLEKFEVAFTTFQPLQMEYRLLRYDGVYRYMLDIADPRHDKDGQFAGFVGCTVDMTDQKENQIELHDSHNTLAERSREITTLNELNDNLQVCNDISETRKILNRFGRQLFPELSGTICLYKSSRNVVEPFVSWGPDQHLSNAFKPDACWALRKGKVHTEDHSDAGFICPNVSEECAHGVSYVCIPMMAYGEVIGIMHMGLSEQDSTKVNQSWQETYSPRRKLATMTADQVALTLANLQLRETLQYQSTRDPLTSLFNRRYFYECIERELFRAENSSTSFAVLMADIDSFKKYNDTHGHDAGDLVLREVAVQMKRIMRQDDVVCRYGGEEFAVLMSDSPRETVLERTERLCSQIKTMQVNYRGQTLPPITLSVGVAFFPLSGDSAPELIESADRALYAAKNAGRDQVVVFDSMDQLGNAESRRSSD